MAECSSDEEAATLLDFRLVQHRRAACRVAKGIAVGVAVLLGATLMIRTRRRAPNSLEGFVHMSQQAPLTCEGVGRFPWNASLWNELVSGAVTHIVVECHSTTFAFCGPSACVVDALQMTSSCACYELTNATGFFEISYSLFLAKSASYCDGLYQAAFLDDHDAAGSTVCGAIQNGTLWKEAGFEDITVGSIFAADFDKVHVQDVTCTGSEDVFYTHCMGAPCKASGSPDWPLTCACYPFKGPVSAAPALIALQSGCEGLQSKNGSACAVSNNAPKLFIVTSQETVDAMLSSARLSPYSNLTSTSACPISE
mmetsp:Transcript_24418/g.66658  ORF Transcript_24418/g.66658 Transcript_24418/m.66658 type:complete len:311 (-) Transcript_24418:63-995(-)|eukprot:CAMPEP_0171190246 /NCGR_PEP_ID=MMETSP0790-20130122/18759_1 /TAXON_ID=2925 /ORGANISM="Alexandrium catenella, Strain OF101" /LENGTH=310 /DNA_ID=CAMNT_0011655375 /DNA_START=79 /DNA_END=1011 /DNA_ORIENTATION=+